MPVLRWAVVLGVAASTVSALWTLGPAKAESERSFVPVRYVARPGDREFSGRLTARPVQPAAWVARGLTTTEASKRVAAARQAMKRFNVHEYVPQTDEYVFDVPAGKTENGVANALLRTGHFQYVEPDWVVFPIACPNDPRFGNQWHHVNMQSCAGWDIHTGNPSVSVGICDTGVLTSHEDLQLHRLEGYNAVDRQWESQGGQIGPVHPHGTQTTGCAAANGNNGKGVSGVGWNLSHRMLRVSNSSSGSSSLSTLNHAARTAVENGDRVASVSYSGVDNSTNLTSATYIKSIGGLLVWAAGNDSRNLTFGNRDNDDLIVAGATDQGDGLAWFSNFGQFVDLVAPGVSIHTTTSNGGYTSVNGTSFACPLTAGLIGLIWSADPTLTPNQVEALLKQTVDDLGSNGVDNTFGYGRINVFNAMTAAGGGNDCNGNGIPDDQDIGNGTSQDCNGNGVPDECDIADGTSQDCNTNGIPDECETDCNGNGVPDDCDLANGTSQDCNGNGVPDECDIANGTSSDCNANGIPDECETDCNGNGVPDDCDIANGTSQDCNGNGVPDECDIAGGTSSDCNANGIPDECETDCNGNGVPDDCDLANGTSQDCNGNGVPDECDIANGTSQDCNANGVPDECDLANGTSQDCNGDGVPDECEPDCNGNGVPDDCDIANGTSQDCNGNGVPDECDIANGTSPDCNANGIPDECEADCNGNGVPDDCDIANGTSQDCNTNGVPDECDIANGTSEDCNQNGIPDECDGGGGGGADCNGNGIPDDCDIANGTSQDCNGNSVPDECDIADGTSSDCNANGIPDECETDCNGNGVPDDCDIANGTSEDCNGNGVPDECDIAGGTSQDCNANGIPDECELDCNGNGVADECDIADGTSQDCNGNGVPDECDIASGLSQDCNGNGIPDECEPDCNGNGVPDDCDIANGTSQDCNGNGVPDECDIANGTSSDCNANGIPDECEPDCNNNGVPDDCDIANGTSQDCNGNGVPDECDITSGTSKDCNANGVPDECDIANGTSQDTNGNGIPDECENGRPGEGFILSLHADFSTDDRVFTRNDTIYMIVWSDQVDYDNLRKAQWELRDANKNKVKRNLTNQFDGTYTASFDLAGLPSSATSWQWKGKVEDQNRTKFNPTATITVLTAPECQTDADCDDGLFCNGLESCMNGSCQPGSDPCPGQSCDEVNDVCVSCQSDADCDDGLFCNGQESCVNGSCEAGTPPCAPDEVCNEDTDSCDNGQTGEGFILSKNPDFSTDDRTFTRGDTLYMLVWSDRVDFNDLRKAQWELRDANKNKVKRNLTNQFDGTYTASFNLSGLPSNATSWRWKGKVEDQNRTKFNPTATITVQ